LSVNVARMREAAGDPMLLATDLAEVLVREGVPFREAHEAVGSIVGHCSREGVDLRSLDHAQMRSFHEAFPAAAVELLDLERSFEQRKLVGGTARPTVAAALERASAQLDEEERSLEKQADAGEVSR
ncbi:MAG: hypothetical protein JRG96_20795, partial [Deltaproteobacteria bacterium]|nr:hypothetical protein [Deltaproteobacteria bacterium]